MIVALEVLFPSFTVWVIEIHGIVGMVWEQYDVGFDEFVDSKETKNKSILWIYQV